MDMIEDIVGTNGSRFVLAIGVVALGLLCLVAVLWFIRNRPSSPFIRGGKNRQPRLAVLDAAAVDTRRRLVLIRRDDVEHLIMIGGPTDIVIESRIAGSIAQAAPSAIATTTESIAPVARPAVERRLAPPQATPHAEQRSQTTAPQVSAMSNVLYGENFDQAPQARSQQVPVQQQAPVQRPRMEAPVARPVPQSATPAPQRAAGTTVPAASPSVQHARTPEDILEAARNRVLPTAQPAAVTPVPEQRTPAADFERILDAEISGDLSRLNVGSDMRVEADPRGKPADTGRQEPVIGAGRPRNEPTLEEEMNRMLGEMSAGEKR
jgi:hypothetical protein